MRLRQVSTVFASIGALCAMSLFSANAAVAESGRLSLECRPDAPSPEIKYANFSWNSSGSSVTVYYNNHCALPKAVTVLYENPEGTGYECVVAPGLTKGSKKVTYGAAGWFKGVLEECR